MDTTERLTRLRTWMRRPPVIVGLSILGMWALTLIYLHVRTRHAAPDYSDFLREVESFFIPWQSGESKLRLLLTEYQPLGHSHIVSKLLLLASGLGGGYDFSLLSIVGRIANFTLLAGAFVFVGRQGTRDGFRWAWWVAVAVALAWIRPESLMDLTNNWLAMEWIYIGAGVGYLAVLARFLHKGSGPALPLIWGIALACVGDAPGATALLVGAGVTTWWAIRTRALERTMAIVLVPIVTAFVVGTALRPWRTFQALPARLDGFDPVSIVRWVAKGLSQSVINLGDTEWSRYGSTIAIPTIRVIAVMALAAILTAAAVWLSLRVRVTATTGFLLGLVGFGLVAILGAFASRQVDFPNGVVALRYVRLFTPLFVGVIGLALLHLDDLGLRWAAIGVGVALSLIVAFRIVAAPPIDDLVTHFDYLDQRFSQYESGTWEQQPDAARDFYLFQFWPPHREDPAIVVRVMDWLGDNMAYDR